MNTVDLGFPHPPGPPYPGNVAGAPPSFHVLAKPTGAMASFANVPGSLCVHSETCGTAVALEHNGDLYSCDHFVEPDFLLGNIGEPHLLELMASPQQQAFGKAKRDSLPEYCRARDVRFACHGGCPKDRFTPHPTASPDFITSARAIRTSSGMSTLRCA
ncbi:MAG: SPASM domain-containing protein [Actinomycetota bacterium]